MNAESSPTPSPPRRHFWRWVGLGCLVLFLATALGTASLFLLNSDARVMRDEMSGSLGTSSMRTRIQLSLGPVTTGLARFVIGHIKGVDEDARLALSSLRSVSVGIYTLKGLAEGEEPAMPDITALDERMRKRGWARIVRVKEHRQTVLVYGPKETGWRRTLPLCIAVRDGRQLIVVSLRGNPAPLLKIAQLHHAL